MDAIPATVPAVLADTLNFRLLVAGLCLAGAFLVGAFIIALVSRWRRHSDGDDSSPGAQLARFRSLYEAGTISQEEFERLRSLLGAKMREDWRLPVPPKEPEPPGATPPDGSIRPA
jgi:hypothetical protein